MITRKQLEGAAIAAGMTPARMDDDGAGLLCADMAETWRPHTDIADAARLMVGLRMHVEGSEPRKMFVQILRHAVEPHDGTQADAERAYCEAVTLCAAAVGERMREGGGCS